MTNADLDACASLVAKGDPDRFSALLASPIDVRPVMLPIYAFNLEVSRAPWLTEEAMIAEMRLQWWRDVLDEIETGKHVRRHEVASPLAKVLKPSHCAVLDRLIAMRRWDIYRDTFENPAHFEAYLDHTSAGLMWVIAQQLGAVASHEPHVRSLGYASGLARFFIAVPDLLRRGRQPLLTDDTSQIASLADEALLRLASATRALRELPKSARPALKEAWMAKPVLQRAKRAPHRVLDKTLAPSELEKRLRLFIV